MEQTKKHSDTELEVLVPNIISRDTLVEQRRGLVARREREIADIDSQIASIDSRLLKAEEYDLKTQSEIDETIRAEQERLAEEERLVNLEVEGIEEK